jgi:hypothetical protein
MIIRRPTFWVRMFLLLCLIPFAHWYMVRQGFPQIETTVRREILSLARTEESLRSLELGHMTAAHVNYSGTGYFRFDGSYSNQSWHIVVNWRKADTTSPIDTIKIGSNYRDMRSIWSRQ